VPDRHDDLFEHAQVTSTTGLRSASLDGMFGGDGEAPEPSSLLLGDTLPQ
jgi:hypothetical protein